MTTMILTLIASGLTVLSIVSMLVAVIGMLRFRDTERRLHVAGKAVLIGIVSLLLASVGTQDLAIIGRAVVTAVFLLVTAPMASHAIGHAATKTRHEASSDARQPPT